MVSRGEEGGGRGLYSFVGYLSRMAIDRVSLAIWVLYILSEPLVSSFIIIYK